jgi:hypothetical protein
VPIPLSKTCLLFVWKIVRTPLLVVDKDNHLLKPSFYLSVLQMKSSSTYLITASLCEGPFFTFMLSLHLLPLCTIQESIVAILSLMCIVPKFIIDWFMIMVSLVLKLFVSSRPFKLECVLCIYVLLFHEGQAENYLLCFSIWFEQHVWLLLFHYSWSFVCVSFHVITWLLSFYCQDYFSYAHVLSSLIPALNALLRWSRLWWCMLPPKIILLLSLTYSRTSRS